MSKQVTFSKAIHTVAMRCAMLRAQGIMHPKKPGVCICGFQENDWWDCKDCDDYIGRYIDADPLQMELYMKQVDKEAWAKVARNKQIDRANAGAVIRNILVVAFFVWLIMWFGDVLFNRSSTSDQQNPAVFTTSWVKSLFYKATGVTPRSNTSRTSSTVQQPAPIAPVVQSTSGRDRTPTGRAVTEHDIIPALIGVAYQMGKGYDANRNGLVNCEDAAIIFYQYFNWSVKDKVWIYVNHNPDTGMNHAFNLVYINGVYRAIEPQAYFTGRTGSDYYMRDIWGAKYDPAYNVNAWSIYGEFAQESR